jgi:hypothetical protein
MQSRRRVPDLLQRAMRNILEIPDGGLWAAHHQHAVESAAVTLGLGVGGVERAHTVHEEPIAVELGRQCYRRGPDACIVLRHGQIGGVDPAAIESDEIRLGRVKAEGDPEVRSDLGRLEMRSTSRDGIRLRLSKRSRNGYTGKQQEQCWTLHKLAPREFIE